MNITYIFLGLGLCLWVVSLMSLFKQRSLSIEIEHLTKLIKTNTRDIEDLQMEDDKSMDDREPVRFLTEDQQKKLDRLLKDS